MRFQINGISRFDRWLDHCCRPFGSNEIWLKEARQTLDTRQPRRQSSRFRTGFLGAVSQPHESTAHESRMAAIESRMEFWMSYGSDEVYCRQSTAIVPLHRALFLIEIFLFVKNALLLLLQVFNKPGRFAELDCKTLESANFHRWWITVRLAVFTLWHDDGILASIINMHRYIWIS